jgi:hypothetical protein
MTSSPRTLRRLPTPAIACLITVAIGAGNILHAQNAKQPTIDLRAATLNGRPLASWTLDEITDSLGRPTAVTSGIGGVVGPQLYYHARGISLWFDSKEKDPSQHLWMATVYLARSWDNDRSQWFAIFDGTLTPAVDGGWKSARLMTEFAALTPTLETAADYKKQLKAAGVAAQAPQNDFMRFNAGGAQVTIALEPNTSFAERIILRRQQK